MTENKKLIAIIIAIIVVIAGAIGISYVGKEQEKKLMQKYTDLVNSKETEIIYLGRAGCSYCQQFTPIMNEMKEEYGIDYTYIDTDELSQSNLSDLLKMLNVDETQFGTPHLSIVKEGKVLGTQMGYTDKEGLFNFYKENGILGEDAVLKTDDEYLTKIDFSKYRELIAEDNSEKSIIVLGQTGCSACNSARPVLSNIAQLYGITINYLNITDLSEEESSELSGSFEELQDDFGTPFTLIVQNGKIVDTQSGYLDEATFVTFFQENGLIEE